MSVASLDTLRHETRFALSLMRRYRAKRFATGAMVLGLAALAGAPETVVVGTAALIAAVEAGVYLAQRSLQAGGGEPGAAFAVATWVLNILSTVAYLVPALLLVRASETHWIIAALIWIFGVFVHVSNSYASLPLYNWGAMAPAFGMGLGALALAGAGHPGEGASRWHWGLVAGLFVVYCANTVETIRAQKDTQAELAEARAEARARLAALERAARFDPLTGLLNRQAFEAALIPMLRDAGQGRAVAVLSLDLDGFKPLNDTFGHAAGDAVLAVTGRRLNAFVGADGVAGRIGGDELVLAMPGVRSSRMALDLALRLGREVERPVSHEGKALRVGASVGVALGGEEAAGGDALEPIGARADRLLAAADRAMLAAKATAHGGAEHGPVLHDPSRDPPRLGPADRRRLAEALAGGEVGPRYAPVRDLATGALAGFEAEAAWGPPGEATDDGAAPERAALLARAAELGLQGDLLVAMAERALRDVEALLHEGLDPGRVTVPVPEMALATRNGRRDLDRLLAAHPRARGRLALGLPADVLTMRGGERVREGVAHLRAMGVGIVIHGFGTGQACFRHLPDVSFDELRVDAGFVAELGRDKGVRAAVDALSVLARGLGARLVADGVASEDARRALLLVECRLGRGPLLGAALDAEGMRRALLAAGQGPQVRAS